ncbi:subtilase-type protease inhibitor [Streptomyces sp. NBC_01619]|uniref:SSI family serine proteinase inhibitor n=1 Tax=Streptomyces pratisoli TaxID=3139917 RepID=A0ACC6QJ45_9ACTN|nr:MULTISPECIES: SSI family serine proteinase inhibitor [unclassified Streptomyces]MCX4511874.1 subtilase-type protease inhibitor [Streptomyces sp. NBC_01619]
MLRRFVLIVAATATASVAALTVAVPTAGAAPSAPIPLPLLESEPGDQLTVITSDTGNPEANGTYELKCGPAGGTHPEAQAACDKLAEFASAEEDPFTPVDQDRMCTMQHGGPATARVTGTWQGRSIDATFDRTNGCEIKRWETLEPVLPTARNEEPDTA